MVNEKQLFEAISNFHLSMTLKVTFYQKELKFIP